MTGRVISAVRLSGLEWWIAVAILLHSLGITEKFVDATGQAQKVETIFWFSAYLYCILSLFAHYRFQWLMWLIRYRLLLLFICLGAVVSIGWSVYPILTLQRSIHLLGTTCIAFYIGFRIPPKDAISVISSALAIILVGGALVSILLPDIGIQLYGDAIGQATTHVWMGLQSNKNALGFTAAIGVLFFGAKALLSKGSTRGLYGILIVVALVDLVMSRSATSLGALLLGLLVANGFYLVSAIRMNGINAIVLLAMLLAIVLAVLLGHETSAIVGEVGRSGDFSGRSSVWAAVEQLLKKWPWTGTGYGSLWFPRPGEEYMQQRILEGLTWIPSTAHNSFLHVAAELGYPLAILSTLFFLQVLLEPLTIYLRRGYSFHFSLVMIAFLCSYAVGDMFEARFLVDRNALWILYVSIPIVFLRSIELESISGDPSSIPFVGGIGAADERSRVVRGTQRSAMTCGSPD